MRIVSTAFLLFFLITSPVRAAINGVAAVVNGEMITAFDLQAETAPEAMRRGLNPKDPNQAAAIEELTKATLERMINNIILTQEAQRLKISVGDSEVDNEIQQIMSRNKMTPEEFQRQLQIQRTTEKDFRERIRSSILRNRLLANMVGRKVIVTKEEIADYYNQHKQTFMNNQKVRFAVIVYPPTENAEAQAARIRSGKLSFEQAARQVSVGPRAQEGGVWALWIGTALDPTWQDRLSQLKPGDVSGLFEVNNGIERTVEASLYGIRRPGRRWRKPRLRSKGFCANRSSKSASVNTANSFASGLWLRSANNYPFCIRFPKGTQHGRDGNCFDAGRLWSPAS